MSMLSRHKVQKSQWGERIQHYLHYTQQSSWLCSVVFFKLCKLGIAKDKSKRDSCSSYLLNRRDTGQWEKKGINNCWMTSCSRENQERKGTFLIDYQYMEFEQWWEIPKELSDKKIFWSTSINFLAHDVKFVKGNLCKYPLFHTRIQWAKDRTVRNKDS